MKLRCGCCDREVFKRQIKYCRDCGDVVCAYCLVGNTCSTCNPNNNATMVTNDYFKDKYADKSRGLVQKALFIVMVFAFLVLASGVAAAFDNERIVTDITHFEWSFDNPWGADTVSLKDYWNPYIINEGCADVDIQVFYEVPTTEIVRVCHNENACEYQDLESLSLNGTKDKEWVCNPKQVCDDETRTTLDYIDVTKTDYLIPEDARIVVKGKRKAKTTACKVDMNFLFDDGVQRYDAKDGGVLGLSTSPPRAWWDTDWNVKYPLTITTTNDTIYGAAFRLDLNSTDVDMSDCSTDDIRILNSTEDGTIPINISYWNSTHGRIFANTTLNFTGYLYCNNSGASSVSQSLISVGLAETSLTSLWKMDEWNADSVSPDETGSYDATLVGGLTNKTGINHGAFGHGVGGARVFVNNSFNIMNSDFAITAWVNRTGGSGDRVMYDLRDNGDASDNGVIFADSSARMSVYMTDCGDVALTSTSTFAANDYVFTVFKRAGNNISIWMDGTMEDSVDASACTFSGASNNELRIGARNDNINLWAGEIDEFAIYERDLSVSEMDFMLNSDVGRFYTYYDIPTVATVGAREQNVFETALVVGIYDTDFNNVSLTVDEEFLFFPYANYTYSGNGTVITDAMGFCNASATEIEDRTDFSNTGTNLTICGTGCDTDNRTVVMTDHRTDNVYNDAFQFGLCHAGVSFDYHITTNCSSEVYNIDSVTLPDCDAGYINYTIISNNCSAQQNVELSIWSDSNAAANALVNVDSFIVVDTLHNHSGNMVYNASLSTWHFTDAHMYREHGSRTIDIGCYENLTGNVENQTTTLNITVENLPPTVIISDIWWWLLSDFQLFTNETVAKYPLESTINISLLSSDDDLDTTLCWLNYSNGTNIFSAENGGHQILNLSQGNFSTNASYLNGSSGYIFQVWANDSFSANTTVLRWFTAENDAPTVTWDNVTPVTSTSVPISLNWTCADAESESMTSYLFINNSNASLPNVTTSDQNYTFSPEEGSYNLTVWCEDSFVNSTQSTLILTYTRSCSISITSPCSGCRYRDNSVPLTFSCSAGTLDTCWYTVDDYEAVYPTNCSDYNITAELGRNHFVLYTNTTDGVNESMTLDFYAKKLDGVTFADYSILLILLAIVAAVLVMRVFTKVPFFGVVAGLGVLFLAVELFAFDYWMGIFAAACGVVFFVWSVYDGFSR